MIENIISSVLVFFGNSAYASTLTYPTFHINIQHPTYPHIHNTLRYTLDAFEIYEDEDEDEDICLPTI